MSRINPRTVILRALAEGPRPYLVLENEMEELLLGRYQFCGPNGRCFRHPGPITDRLLCKLQRAGRVVRQEDGRWALRSRSRKPNWTLGIEGVEETLASLGRMKEGLDELRDAFNKHVAGQPLPRRSS